MDTPDDLPLLGEPLAIELANTWYGEGEVDFLAEPALATRWIGAAVPDDASPLTTRDAAVLRRLRDAVRALILAVLREAPLDAAAIAVVNDGAAAACAHASWVDGAAQVVFRGPPLARAQARLATSCVELLAARVAVRQCEGPGCFMLFVQQHRHRRFCHDGCSHRARQARYRSRL
jgi:predicted RNA-binding Zn ribbon-like protein